MKHPSKFNLIIGSPRGKGSNSTCIANYFLTAYQSILSDQPQVHYLKSLDTEEQRRIFTDSDKLILVFPLYTDAMPGIVKEYFENLSVLRQSKPYLKLGFIVHSGFPEAHHSVFIARYLEKLTRRLGCQYLGTVIKGGSEGIRITPDAFKKKLIANFSELGCQFARTGEFDAGVVEKLRKPYKLNRAGIRSFKMLKKLGLADYYWNSQLKRNKAFEQRFAQPCQSPL